jgi:uncharacterized protein (DUF2141 family)
MPRILLSLLGALAIIAIFAMGCHAADSPSSQPAAPPTTKPSAHLVVRVTDLRNHNGQLIFGVFKTANGFPSTQGKSLNWQIKRIDADAVEFSADLPPGRYSASVLHDENSNNKMDLNALGIPLEGYGVSNNPKPKYRQARFDEAIFDLPAAGASINISIQYFLK